MGRIFTLLLLVIASVKVFGTSGLDVWHVRTPQLTVSHLRGVAYGNGRFVAVGTSGTIIVSSNGIDWIKAAVQIKTNLNAVTFEKGHFLAGGDGGTILWSEDALTWTTTTGQIASDNNITALGFGTTTNYPNGVFIAAGLSPVSHEATVHSSTNGVDWSSILYRSPAFGVGYTSIAFGQGTFVVGGLTEFLRAPLLSIYSMNAKFWRTINTSPIGPIAYGNGLFVSGVGFLNSNGKLTFSAMTSSSGITWQGGSVAFLNAQAMIYAGGRFVAVGGNGGQVASSTDGTNWSAIQLDTGSILQSVAHGAGRYVVVGRGGFIASSEDSEQWISRSGGSGGRGFYSVTHLDSGFAASGSSGLLARSTTGVNWEFLQAPTTNRLYGIVHGAGVYVAVGQGGTIVSGQALDSLTIRDSGTTQVLVDVAYNGTLFVAVGFGGTILTSSNSMNWIKRDGEETNHFQGVVYGDAGFVTVGLSGVIFSSSDGEHWVHRISGTGHSLRDVQYGNGRYVTTTGLGLSTLVSTDGVQWQNTPVFLWESQSQFGFGSGEFLAQSYYGLAFSRDGQNWTLGRKLETPIYSFAYNPGDGTFIGVDALGGIVQSDPVVSLELTGGQSTQVRLIGPTASYRIESADAAKTPLVWTERATISIPPDVWTDPDTLNATNRVYRAVLVR